MNIISINYKKRIEQIYSKPKTNKRKSLIYNKYFSKSDVKYYSYGRHALFYGLQCIGVKSGDQVLLPALICREVLSAINSLGAIPVFYDVNQELSPLNNFKKSPRCKAVIAVNYFGFPQDLRPFKEYCSKNDAVLIEDNCHGFLSVDSDGKLLGTRSNIGIFSFRKTIPVICGAALFINNNTIFSPTLPKIEPIDYKSFHFLAKKIIKCSFQLVRINGIKAFTSLVRMIRKIRTGHRFPQSDKTAEIKLPLLQAAPLNLFKQLETLDFLEESTRRRELYLWLYKEMKNLGANPVFDDLPKGCVPFGFPFYASLKQVKAIENKLSSIGLETFLWPDLPHEILPRIPNYYKRLRCVRFLW